MRMRTKPGRPLGFSAAALLICALWFSVFSPVPVGGAQGGVNGTGHTGAGDAGGVQAVDFNPRQARQRLGQVRQFDFDAEDVAVEIDFGREVAAHLLGRHQLDQADRRDRYVALVGHSLVRNANRPEIDFRFAVLDTDAVKAFATPGGYIFVSRGALELMEDESELAGVLAHEIIHVTERHIVKELDITSGEGGIASGLARIVGGSGDPARAAFAQAVDQALEILLEEGLSKEDELEADRMGTLLAAQSGYDPEGLRRYLERLRDHSGGETVEDGVSDTHPPLDERLQALEGFMVEMGLADAERPRMGDRFQENMQ
ncbi:M48 family metalloprotease [Halorhodospira halophila]|uniref:Peptidase M48, Ste24p n=1 Tax=Halorhodospira halophila (strain DSM 244 / SL1) TaxID=349124 RepID=A1WY89_HALHL|nr:M48 family metalloprotease [Halorhodospira halophila]ABM62651.1 peptidase M48, Ste24p [Halorhodospira halophila SL1]MBK1728331.1 hypothetical protein [Halorhodospira halophila]